MTIVSDIDFTHPDTFVNGIPHEELAELRRNSPVVWVPQEPGIGGYPDDGYWLVTTHELVREVSRNGKLWSSWENTAMSRLQDHSAEVQVPMQRALLLNMDGPEHAEIRRIISRGFTPRAVEGLRDALRERARDIADRAQAGEQGNFVAEVANELPVQAIADLLGVPQEDRMKLLDWSDRMTGADEGHDPVEAMTELVGYSYGLAAERQQEPQDDIITKLVEANTDGRLTPEEFGYFMILLVVAGSETTRNSIGLGMIAMLENPDQWEKFKAERPETAADEIIRWASPVMSFQRTATEDTVLGGQEIKKGQRVVMLYASANFDEDVFDNPATFDIMRSPNPHVAFGGTGPHYCIGANLARLQVELMFNAIADVMPDITLLGDPVRVRSGWLNSLKSFEVSYGTCPVRH
ncbi:cytochrome P450 [Enemella sp. A6]|uniref:cytochrome P450 n=1 Tax=Enemella sp. A6 TaxID=3440152 RepID=UPI003EBEE3A1